MKSAVEGDTLVLCGDKPRRAGSEKADPDGHGKVFHCKERPEGAFERSIALPVQVDADQATAEYIYGGLRITIPRAEATKARKIAVAVG